MCLTCFFCKPLVFFRDSYALIELPTLIKVGQIFFSEDMKFSSRTLLTVSHLLLPPSLDCLSLQVLVNREMSSSVQTIPDDLFDKVLTIVESQVTETSLIASSMLHRRLVSLFVSLPLWESCISKCVRKKMFRGK